MKRLFLFFTVILGRSAFSQQNFINVPSSEVTTKHKLFFQQQLNFNQIIQSNTTLDFGIGKGFEVGVNVLGLNFSTINNSFLKNDSTDKDPYNPLIMLNGLKHIDLSEKVAIAVGTQLGLNYNDNKKTTQAALVYANLRIEDLIGKHSHLVLGSYYNSVHYGGQGNRVGAWLGLEVPLHEKLHIMGESVLGSNAICYTSFGFVYYPLKRLPLTFGFQIPNTKNNSYSLVFELTFVP